jgi:hypothetical protein
MWEHAGGSYVVNMDYVRRFYIAAERIAVPEREKWIAAVVAERLDRGKFFAELQRRVEAALNV